MSPILLLVWGVAYAGIWVMYMTSPARRSLRSALFLGISSIPLALVGPDDGPGYWLVIGAVSALWALGLWDLNDLLSLMPSAEARFERALWKVRDDVLSHRRRLTLEKWEAGRTEHVALIREAQTRAGELSAPAAEWSQLLSAVERALDFDLSVFTAQRSMNSATASASLARWESIDRQWGEVRRQRSRFWRVLH